ncbi:uncharacterized protein LOC130663669 [Microplitis mediator]|uniref:uncharacterized protein LOC130663669 n=1 Tax=Microplitis mediator TaxID=375433 RepID=UPI0025534843|nr:uncharacterized protein LOC130663669 [Microplitis mediator]
MKTSPRLFNIFVYVRQLMSMEQIKDLFYLLQIICQRTFTYLKDIVLTEFIPFVVDLSNFEVREHKIRYLTFSKQAVADLATFIIIFALFATFLYLSTQYSDEIEHCTPEIDPPPENPPVVDLTEDENDRDSVYEMPTVNYPWGDGSTGPEKIIPRRKNLTQRKSRPYCISTDNESTRSAISIKMTQSQHSHLAPTDSKIFNRPADFTNSWIIRRTRSGQIYGKYPV